MRTLRIGLLAAALLGTPFTASALTVAELLQLAAAGLEDDVLIALIEVSDVAVPEPADLIALKAAGVSKAVILELVRASGASESIEERDRDVPPLPAARPEARQQTVVQLVAPGFFLPYPFVPYPIVVAPGPAGHRGPARPFMEGSGFGRFINDGWRQPPTPAPRP